MCVEMIVVKLSSQTFALSFSRTSSQELEYLVGLRQTTKPNHSRHCKSAFRCRFYYNWILVTKVGPSEDADLRPINNPVIAVFELLPVPRGKW